MSDVSTEKTRKSPGKLWITLGTVGVVVVALVAGGLLWHQKPSFCGALCHTPMDSFVQGYTSGDETLLITQHSTGKSAATCLDCHEPTVKQQATEASHWVSGNYEYPLEQRNIGTRTYCLQSGCHENKKIVEATQNYGGAARYNPHDPRHGVQECYRCHSMHGTSVLMCNQCHKLKLPKGWVSPAINGVVTAAK